jgi:hypothetical protein
VTRTQRRAFTEHFELRHLYLRVTFMALSANWANSYLPRLSGVYFFLPSDHFANSTYSESTIQGLFARSALVARALQPEAFFKLAPGPRLWLSVLYLMCWPIARLNGG